jgi:hypothetical protein
MANSFSVLMTNILMGGLDCLSEEMTLAAKAPKDTSNIAAKPGSTFSVARPTVQTTSSVTPAATPPAPTDVTPVEVTGTLDQWKATRFHVTEKEASEMKDPGVFTGMQAKEAARAIAKGVNAYMHGLYTKIYGYAGTAGTTPFASNIDAMVDVRRVLNRQFCPEGNRIAILDYDAEAKALKLAQFQAAYNRGNTRSLEKGELGEVMGINWYRDSQVGSHTAGTGSGYLINNGGGYAAGIKTVTVDTGTGTILVGDIITFAGVTGTYTVTSALAANSVSFEPGLEGAVADDAAITLKATHVVNIVCDPAAFAVGFRPLAEQRIEGAPVLGEHMVMTHPTTGIPMRLSYYPGYHLAQWEFSLLYGGVIADPRRAARLAG